MAQEAAPDPFEHLLADEGRRVVLTELLANEGFWVNSQVLSQTTGLDVETAQNAIDDLDNLGFLEHHDPDEENVRLDETADAVPELLDAHQELHRVLSDITELSA